MGKKGYKGIAALSPNRFIVNDDGDHVLKLLERRSEGSDEFEVRIIAGKVGEFGCLDAEHGCDALLQRPGRVAVDEIRQIGYFANRSGRYSDATSSDVIRCVDLSGTHFAVTSLPLTLPSDALATASALDFNRLLLSPCGEMLLLCDRRQPLVVLVTQLHSPHPRTTMLYTGGGPNAMPVPLQAAVWPSSYLPSSSSLPFCYLGTADEIWQLLFSVPHEVNEATNSSAQQLLRVASHSADSSGTRAPFLCHELIALPSSAFPSHLSSSEILVALNRHRKGTGVYQINLQRNSYRDSSMRYIGGKDWVAPHGMCLVPEAASVVSSTQEEKLSDEWVAVEEEEQTKRWEILVVETGQGAGNNNKKGGRVISLQLISDKRGHVIISSERVMKQKTISAVPAPASSSLFSNFLG